MKVYCVSRHIMYDTSNVCHVFLSEEKAKARVEELDREINAEYVYYDYEEMEVE